MKNSTSTLILLLIATGLYFVSTAFPALFPVWFGIAFYFSLPSYKHSR